MLEHVGMSGFFHSQGWYPSEGLYGIAPMVWASLAITLGAIAIAFPLGIGCAIFMEFYASASVAAFFRMLVNLLAGIPSVVFGLWGLTELVPLIADWKPPGASLLAAMGVLALMILPTVALTCAAGLSGVPKEQIANAVALGFTRKTQILFVAIPAAKSAIVSGVLLAIARALGETMVVLMVAGNVVQNPSGLFEPIRALTANIALEMSYAMGDHRASLFASGLLLTLLVWVIAYMASRVASDNLERR